MSTRLLLCLVALGYIATQYGVYQRAVTVTSARYEARMAQADTARAEAVAQAERDARIMLQTEVERGHSLAQALETQKNALAQERAAISRRIKDASERALADCRSLSAEWVGLYNEALGLATGTDNCAGGSRPGAAVATDSAAHAGPADTGLRPQSLTTPEDVLAHARDYGGWCRTLAAQQAVLSGYVEKP